MAETTERGKSFSILDCGLFEEVGSSVALWAIGLYIVLVPSISGVPYVEFFNEKRAVQIGVLLLVGGVLVLSRSTRRQWLSTFYLLPSSARWGLSVVLSLGLMSSSLAPAPFYAFLEVGHFVLMFVAMGVLASLVHRRPKRIEKVFLGLVVTSVLLYAVYFSVRYGMHLGMAEIKLWPKGKTNFANIRFFNHLQTWTLPLLAGAVLAVPRRWRSLRVGVFGLLALWWTLVFASNVRATIAAVVVAAVGVVLLFRGRATKWVSVQGVAVLVGLGLYYVLFSTSGGGGSPPVVDRVDETAGYIGRIDHWLICLDMAWNHPWLGAGPMHYAWPPINFMPAASPHSALMQWLGEWGVPSTAIMSSLAIWGGGRWMKQERSAAETASTRANAVRVGLVASTLAGTAHAMVSGLLVAPLSQVLLVLVGGWAWGRYRHEDQRKTDSSWSGHVVLVVLLVASMVVVGSSFRDLSNAEERRAAFREAVDRKYYSPRYWTQGYLHVRNPEVLERARRDR